MKRTVQTKNAGIPSASKKSKFKGFRQDHHMMIFMSDGSETGKYVYPALYVVRPFAGMKPHEVYAHMKAKERG